MHNHTVLNTGLICTFLAFDLRGKILVDMIVSSPENQADLQDRDVRAQVILGFSHLFFQIFNLVTGKVRNVLRHNKI